MISDEDFAAACELAYGELLERAPFDTGNLALNAIKIAPYMPYTNDPWEHKWIKMGNFKPGQVVERFRTWDNPNEGWWNDACEYLINLIADLLGGEIKKT